jgi:hypothetical protein
VDVAVGISCGCLGLAKDARARKLGSFFHAVTVGSGCMTTTRRSIDPTPKYKHQLSAASNPTTCFRCINPYSSSELTSLSYPSSDMSQHSRCSEGNAAWFDETSIPTLCWVGCPVPAVILPVATCLIFAFSKYRQYQERQLQWQSPGKQQQQQHRDNGYVCLALNKSRQQILTTFTTTATR